MSSRRVTSTAPGSAPRSVTLCACVRLVCARAPIGPVARLYTVRLYCVIIVYRYR